MASGVLAVCRQVFDTGEDLILHDVAFPREQEHGEARQYDIWARTMGGTLAYSWCDVTERFEQAARFAALAANAADVVLFSKDGILQWVSPSIADVFGWTPEETIGRPGDFLVHPDDLELMHRSRAGNYEGRPSRFRLRMVHKDGGVVWCEARGNSIVPDDWGVEGAVISIRDISEQVAAEEERAAAEERYRLVAENASDVVFVIDRDGLFTWVSPSVESVLGWTPERLVGTPSHLVFSTDEDERKRNIDREIVFDEGRPVEPTEVRVRTAAGALLWMSFRARPVRGSDGSVKEAVVTLRPCQEEVVERRAAATLSAGNVLLAEATSEEELLIEMCETAVRNGGYQFAWYGRVTEAPGHAVIPVASSVAGREYLDGMTISWDDGPLGRGPTGRAARTGITSIERDLLGDSDYSPWKEHAEASGFRSSVSLPVRVDGVVDGTLNVYSEEADAFDQRVVDLLESLARSLGIGIERQRSHRDLELAFANSIDLIAAVVESRDPYTAGHQARVASLSTAIGRELGLDERRIVGLAYAASIHDAGKAGIPIDLLSRPGRLSDEEMALIRRHSKIGWEITSRFDWPWPVAEIVHQHHERMDGTGYPLGLRGEEILLEARIVAVADVYEAASSRRPFRPALDEAQARQIVGEGSGTAFDADVVDAFLRVLDTGFAFEEPRERI